MSREVRQESGKSGRKPWGIVAVSLLDDVVIVGLVFLLLWIFGVELSAWAYAVIGVLLAAFVFIVHRAILTSYRKKRTTGCEGMLGQTGTVIQELNPQGMVQVNGEYWKARSPEGNIGAGENIEITAVRGLSLEVRKSSDERA